MMYHLTHRSIFLKRSFPLATRLITTTTSTSSSTSTATAPATATATISSNSTVRKPTTTYRSSSASQPSSTTATKTATKAVFSKTLNQSLGNIPLESTTTTATKGLPDLPEIITKEESNTTNNDVDWTKSWHGIGSKPFNATIQTELMKELDPKDIEIKPDGLIYLPEIKYRRILTKVFGAGGWGLVPRSETIVTSSLVTREYALICHGQLVSVARGEQDYFNEGGIPTATEGCKSNALMRCCKDLGIGSELWDPVFIKKFKTTFCMDKFVEHVVTKKKKKIWLRKDRQVEYPFK
ncbi:Mgm101p NDAI_0D03380 [Naumovozyma dairenensis CBS 421]|uniref:Mitochondrial genome maintenance protein MGM101 n=1 Tax=Naumovozyma dairenensis (strain ATCC 10597 / BCRC 20456 / CBS 421 / NBRC 0211 / NRRL Y-12639) TaxID=1071378 RepID=G0WA41_NAUDC|nr:hypothetical protein NDAI_0D03380 [Naumovozyma dairenensis CBS 421]CCD24652.1 hypothetical protein NDAI_0D03380 [Naumovozyma dairenensis CBS 421]